MAPGIPFALRRVLRGDEQRPPGVRRECVGDAAEAPRLRFERVGAEDRGGAPVAEIETECERLT